jgi:hypothetical protein
MLRPPAEEPEEEDDEADADANADTADATRGQPMAPDPLEGAREWGAMAPGASAAALAEAGPPAEKGSSGGGPALLLPFLRHWRQRQPPWQPKHAHEAWATLQEETTASRVVPYFSTQKAQ